MVEYLREITIEITNRCNLQCRICNIWKEKEKSDLSLKDIKRIMNSIKNPITVALTGGEPFLNPHIHKIYRYLFMLYLQKKIRKIDIATNAFSNKILSFVENNKHRLAPLSLSISIDGFRETHNRQRGKSMAFEKSLKNILILKKYHVPLNLKFVISKINYKDILKVYTLSKQLNCNLFLKHFEQLKNYYHRTGSLPNLRLNDNKRLLVKKVIDKIYTLEKEHNKSSLYLYSLFCLSRSLLKSNLIFLKECFTPKFSLFITNRGRIYSCLKLNPVGSIKNWPSLEQDKYNKIITDASSGVCPKCLSFHGYLKKFNI